MVALVDVNVILESLTREDTQVGAWVNIMGYVERVLKEGKSGQRQAQGRVPVAKDKRKWEMEAPKAVRVKVQAIILWSAGGVKIGEYERTLEERLKLEKG